jgi:hypothetical protein
VSAEGFGPWIRPVSARPSEEVSEYERQYEDGSDPKVLDIIDIPLLDPTPRPYQPENWTLDPDYYWQCTGRASWNDLGLLEDHPQILWTNTSSTYQGQNDRVSLREAQRVTGSLFFLRVRELTLRVFVPGLDFGKTKRRVQACFLYGGASYRLWVTDPIVERRYLAGEDGQYQLGECYITVSLGEPYQEYCYKLVAALLQRNVTR